MAHDWSNTQDHSLCRASVEEEDEGADDNIMHQGRKPVGAHNRILKFTKLSKLDLPVQ
jgi:hypothetical protein